MTIRRSDKEDIVQLAAFRVGDEEYVVDIMRVREIIRPVRITPVRKGPKFVEGVINLRGSVIPIVDLRRRFDLAVENHSLSKIIIMTIEQRSIGLLVDGVTEVVRVPRTSIRPAPGLLESDSAPYFLGICHHKGRTLILLNVKNIIVTEEVIDINSATEMMQDIIPESSPSGRGV